jgi:hypothetical protein
MMLMSWFVILFFAFLIGFVVLIAASRPARRVFIGLGIAAVVFVTVGALALFTVRAHVGARRSAQTRPTLLTYPPELESDEVHTVDGVTIGNDKGVVVRNGSRSITVNGRGVSMINGNQSIRVSSDGNVEMNENVLESDPSAATADRHSRSDAKGSLPARLEPTVTPQPVESTETGSATDEWIDASQADFEANSYPSERSAAVALVRLMTRSWEGVLPPGQEPDKVLVNEKSNLKPETVQAVLQALQKKLGDGRVEMDYSHRGEQIEAMQETIRQMYGPEPPASAPAKTEPDTTVRVTVSGDFHNAATDRGRLIEEKRGNTVEVTLSGPAGKRTRSASFVNKPWVEYGIDRAAQRPGQERIVSRSKRLCGTQSEAEREAIANAARDLLPLVRSALERLEANSKNGPSPGITLIRQTRQDDELFESICSQLKRGTGVWDQFSQQLRKDYGNVWQHAVLINASDAQITEHAQTFLPQVVQERTTAVWRHQAWMRTGVGIVLMTILIAVVYAFLNAATRGYYTWVLRGSMVVLVLAGAALLLFMA